MSEAQQPNVTRLLEAWRAGDKHALDQIMQLVYDRLHALASGYMHRAMPEQTLSATALVHEMYLKFAGTELTLHDRAHFLAVAATTMRHILIDRARNQHRIKRGGELKRFSIEAPDAERGLRIDSNPLDVLSLNQALEGLKAQDERKARLLELVYFGGLTAEESAVVLEVSVPTIHRDLRLAKAWLKLRLSGNNA